MVAAAQCRRRRRGRPFRGGERETAATGTADVDTGRQLTAADRLPVASLTKPVVATAAVQLWQQRGIVLNSPIVNLLPELAPHWRASRRITLRHLLSHTSGLRPDVPPEELTDYGDAEDALAQAVRRTVQHGQIYRPGAAWRYGNAGYALAGYALGMVAATTFELALHEELFAAAGMSRTGFDPGDAVGHADGAPVRAVYARARRPGGGLVSTVDDMLSFAGFAMGDAASWLATGGAVASSQMGSRYGLGWNLERGDRVRWHAGDWGGCHSMLLMVPSRRIAVVVVATDDAAVRLRRDFAWAELGRMTGVRRPRVTPGCSHGGGNAAWRGGPGGGCGGSPYPVLVTALLGPADIRQLAERLGVRPTKTLGQNFVHDPNTVRRIVRAAELAHDDVVVEVGPGLGSLTLGLLPAVAHVHAVEIDRTLAAALSQTAATHAPEAAARLTVHARDALALTGAELDPAPTALVANLPYNVAVPVVLHLLAELPSLRSGLVMVQQEVADRLTAPPGSKVYGVPSAKLAWYASARHAGRVPASVFWPVPRVESGLVSFTRRPVPSIEVSRADVFAVIDAAFAQRRKMLRSALSNWAGSSAAATAILERAGVAPTARGEVLDVGAFVAIAVAGAGLGATGMVGR